MESAVAFQSLKQLMIFSVPKSCVKRILPSTIPSRKEEGSIRNEYEDLISKIKI